jgi:hypothetical protein
MSINALSDQVSQLSLDNPNVPTLPRVSVVRDQLTDEDHKALDEQILNIIQNSSQGQRGALFASASDLHCTSRDS